MRLIFWITTAMLFLFRSKRSTLALGLMIFFAVGTLVFISAVAVGINDSMILNSTGLYSGHITGINLPETITRKTLFVDGVSNVLQRFSISGSVYFREKRNHHTRWCSPGPGVEKHPFMEKNHQRQIYQSCR